MNDIVDKFEKLVANFYGAPYAVAVDCCTHAIE
jgi:dTDP-4-amino-4,6-dideoxygalactose transaminase